MDLSKFNRDELMGAGEILQSYANYGVPDTFWDENVTLELNPNTGVVFLANDNGDTALLGDDGKLYSFYITTYAGLEGSWEDLLDQYDDGYFEYADDVEYLIHTLSNEGQSEEAERVQSEFDANRDQYKD